MDKHVPLTPELQGTHQYNLNRLNYHQGLTSLGNVTPIHVDSPLRSSGRVVDIYGAGIPDSDDLFR